MDGVSHSLPQVRKVGERLKDVEQGFSGVLSLFSFLL